MAPWHARREYSIAQRAHRHRLWSRSFACLPTAQRGAIMRLSRHKPPCRPPGPAMVRIQKQRIEPMARVALYARYSSDNQREASIADQFALCEHHAAAQGWEVVARYGDSGISGASLVRPSIQNLLQEAQRGTFTAVLAEALDRLSRDQEDIAGVYKRLSFAGVQIITLSEGFVSDLHIGLKGTMNALYLKDLADKTRRGLRGRVEAGKSGGGNSYGYDVLKRLEDDGTPATGERTINPAQARIVRRIFKAYAKGISPRAIAKALNDEGVPGPSGKAWGSSTIHGNAKRGTGILNNELYIGRLVLNRLRYIKEPETGRRVSLPNPESAWLTKDVPALRIIDQDLWDAVKQRQLSQSASRRPPASPATGTGGARATSSRVSPIAAPAEAASPISMQRA